MMILRLSSKCSSEYDVETSVGILNLSNMCSIYSNTSLSHLLAICFAPSFFQWVCHLHYYGICNQSA